MCEIKIKNVVLRNFKNVENGTININVDFETMTEGNVIGVYGQNGSGKTALVEAFKILSYLLRKRQLPTFDNHLIMDDKDVAELEFEFLLSNDFGEFYIRYRTSLGYKENDKSDEIRLVPIKEELEYRENEHRKQYKRLISKTEKDIYIRNVNIKDINEDDRVDLRVRYNMTLLDSYSFIFDKGAIEIFKNNFNEIENSIVKCIVNDFTNDFHVIDSVHNGLVLGNLVMPLSISIQNQRGQIPYLLTDVSVLPLKAYETIEKTIEQINIVLTTIIPGLKIESKKLHTETMENGEKGVRVEFLTNKTNVPLPIRCESAGALKIISILSTLIAVFNNQNACVVVDELDSGVFEFLLGEILEVISDNGRGQLIFTSHNLRVLEVLNNKNLWFTTTNENNRYIQLKGIKNLSNVRDVYLRSVQLGGQNESLYERTKAFKMKKAFRKAGDNYNG